MKFDGIDRTVPEKPDVVGKELTLGPFNKNVVGKKIRVLSVHKSDSESGWMIKVDDFIGDLDMLDYNWFEESPNFAWKDDPNWLNKSLNINK